MSNTVARNGEREKLRVHVEGERRTSGERRMALKGEEAPTTRAGSTGRVREKVMGQRPRRSSCDFDEKSAVMPRLALRELSSSQQPTSRPSSGTTITTAKCEVKSSGSRVTEKSILSRGVSAMAHVSTACTRSKKSPQSMLRNYRDEAPSKTALVNAKMAYKGGQGKGSTIAVSTPPQGGGLGRKRVGEKPGGRNSPLLCVEDLKNAKPTILSIGAVNSAKAPNKVVGGEVRQPAGVRNIQSSLHGRLSALEGRVSQMAAELRETMELLDASNPICSEALLSDIQSKITNIEECMTGSSPVGARGGSIYSPRVDDVSLRERIQIEQEAFKRALQSLTDAQRRSMARSEHPQCNVGLGKTLSTDSSTATESEVEPHFQKNMVVGSEDLTSNASSFHTSKMQDLNGVVSAGEEMVGGPPDLAALAKAMFKGTGLQNSKAVVESRPPSHQKLVDSQAPFHEELDQHRELLRIKLADLGGDRQDVNACEERVLVGPDFGHDEECSELDDDKPLERLKVYLEDPKESLCTTDISRGRLRVNTLLAADKAQHYVQDTRSYYPSKVASPRSYGAERLVLSGTGVSMVQGLTEQSLLKGSLHPLRNHRYSDATSDSPSSERESPLYFDVQEDTKVHCFNSSVKADFAEIDHLRVSDGSHISSHPSKDDGVKQPVHIKQDKRVLISDPYELGCNNEDLDDENDRDLCISMSPGGANGREKVFSHTSTVRPLQLGKKTTTAGWFVSEGDGILLAHDDGCCSFYDVANMEEKIEYKAPASVASSVWGDCWMIGVTGMDGCASKYIVAASAAGARNAAFCSWDYYEQSIAAYHCQPPSLLVSPEASTAHSSVSEQARVSSPKDQRCPGSNLGFKKWLDRSSSFSLRSGGTAATTKTLKRSSSLNNSIVTRLAIAKAESKVADLPPWWYRPCGALIASAGSGLRTVSLYDIRDGDLVMQWDTKKSVAAMKYSSPLQWRTRGKVVLAESESLSVWDVNSLEARRLHNVNLVGKKLRALHVQNDDAECSGGVRQRLSLSDHHSDGTLCTSEAVNVLDFRVPSGIGMRFPFLGEETHSIFANGDTVYTGTTCYKTKLQFDGTTKVIHAQCKVNQWSIRQGKAMNVYNLGESSSSPCVDLSIAQVWGSSDNVLAATENGLFLFDAANRHSINQEPINPRDVLVVEDLQSPQFDLMGSRVLLVSKDRPAVWCHWL